MPLPLIRQSQVVVRIRILRHQRNRPLVCLHRIRQTLQLIQHIAQVEERQRILRVSLGCTPVVPFGLRELPQVIVHRPQVDRRRRMSRPHRQNPAIKLHRLFHGRAVLFQLHRAQEHLLHIRVPCTVAPTRSDHAQLPLRQRIEVERQLPCNRIHQRAAVAERQPRPPPHRSRLGQRVSHADHLAHRIQRSPDAPRGNPHRPQSLQRLQLRQVLKRIFRVDGNQLCLLPRRKLALAQVQNSQDVLTAVSGHVWVSTGTIHPAAASIRRAPSSIKALHRNFVENTWISRTKRGSPQWPSVTALRRDSSRFDTGDTISPMDITPITIFVASVVLLLIASSMPMRLRPIKNLNEYREMARRKGLSMEEINRYVHPLIERDRNVQITVQVVISFLILGAALFLVVSNKFGPRDQRWAYASAGAVLGFWLS